MAQFPVVLCLYLLAWIGSSMASPRAAALPPYPTNRPARSRSRFSGSTVSVDLVRSETYKRNGPAEYAWAFMKYGKTPVKTVQKTSKFASGPVSAINQSYDREYLSPIYIGTPGQLCWLDLDTGSADLWLFSTDTPRVYLDGQNIYHPEKSQTATNVANASWSISYGDGSYAGGAVYRDAVVLGDVALLNVTVESATAVSRSLTTDPVMSGILGLAFNHTSTTFPNQPTLLDALSPQLQKNLFAVDLKYQAAGSYQFGYYNESAYTGEISWQPVIPESKFWQIYVQSIHIAGDNVWRMHDWPMITDTGTSLLLLPSDLVQLYWSFVPGSYFSETYYGWVFPCNVTLPDFGFGFVDGWNASIPGHYFNFQNVTPNVCYGGIQDSMETFGILGDAFLKALYVIFDIGQASVGFATKQLAA